tara:strand:+ start:152 stop:535 length:384 start_codon:yes stop_codon:yes gene_type:complete
MKPLVLILNSVLLVLATIGALLELALLPFAVRTGQSDKYLPTIVLAVLMMLNAIVCARNSRAVRKNVPFGKTLIAGNLLCVATMALIVGEEWASDSIDREAFFFVFGMISMNVAITLAFALKRKKVG